jgi:hypothetical protein
MKKVIGVLLIMMIMFAMMCSVAFATDGVESVEADGFWGYIVEKAYVLIPALYLLGLFMKKVPKIPDWVIPLALLGLGILGAVLLVGFTIDGVIQGVLVAGVTVFVNQAYKQIAVKRLE